MFEIWKAALEQLDQGRDFALATIPAVKGSVPRRAGARLLVDGSGNTMGTVGGGSFEAGVRELAVRALEAQTSYRSVFTFCAGEMVCGGEGDVLVEFVSPDDVLYHKIIRRLVRITKSKGSAYLISEIPMDVGGSSSYALKHALMDWTGFRVGGFPGCLDLIESLRGREMLKSAQLTELGGWEYPVFLKWIKPAGTVYVFGAGHVGVSVAPDASEKEIRKRYRRLCKRFHPDLNQDDPQAAGIFRDVKRAHETIMSRIDAVCTGRPTSQSLWSRTKGISAFHGRGCRDGRARQVRRGEIFKTISWRAIAPTPFYSYWPFRLPSIPDGIFLKQRYSI